MGEDRLKPELQALEFRLQSAKTADHDHEYMVPDMVPGRARPVVPRHHEHHRAQVLRSQLMASVPQVALSDGSACETDRDPDYVLKAIGRPAAAHHSIRCQIGRTTTAEEIDRAIELLVAGIAECGPFSKEKSEVHREDLIRRMRGHQHPRFKQPTNIP